MSHGSRQANARQKLSKLTERGRVHLFRFQASDAGTLAPLRRVLGGLIASLLKGYTRKTLDKGIRSVLRTSRPSRAASRRGNVCALRGATLTVRFLRELAMLAALAYWGFTVGDGVGGPSSALSRRHRAAPAGEPHHGRRTA